MSKTDSIEALALFSGESLRLPISNKRNTGDFLAYGGSAFKTNILFKELAEQITTGKITKLSEYAKIHENFILFHIKKDDGTADDYCIRLLSESDNESCYIISGMEAQILYDKKNRFSMIIPVYLISDDRINFSIVTDLSEGIEYQTTGSFEDFYDFYEATGWYELEKGDNFFIIKGYKKEPVSEKFILPAPLKIKFTEKDEQKYFMVEFI
jgi:hypothetical protein